MTVSKKVIAQALGHGVALVGAYALARQGIHVDASQSAEIAGLASMVVGPVAGYLAKDEQPAETVVNDAERLFATVAESGANPRSVLSAPRPTAPPTATAVLPTAPQ